VAQGETAEDDNAGKRKRRAKRQVAFKLANVGDDWQCKVELGDPMPADEASNLRMAIESTQAGLLSKRTARSRYKLVEDDTSEQERIHIEQIVEQLAPLEAAKLAVARGYVPRKLKLPEGWKQTPEGPIVPDLGNEPEQQPGQPGQPMPGQPGQPDPAMMQAMMGGAGGMPQGAPQGGPMPASQGATNPQQMPTGAEGLPPELIAQLLAMLQAGAAGGQGGQVPAPETMPPDGVNPADMQALSGQGPVIPELDELAGEPEQMMPGMM
jgi:hypothetical protein